MRIDILKAYFKPCSDNLTHPGPPQVTFSKETLGKGAGLPPARATYALEGILCAAGKEAGRGRTLLVDCGVGVLAARGGVMKFTFVQVQYSGGEASHVPRLASSLSEIRQLEGGW